MRRNTTPAITSQMYRHFAVMTVVITGLMAFFANGDSQQATAANMRVNQPRTTHGVAPKPAMKIVAQPDSGSWGSDDGDSASGGAFVSPGAELPNPFALTGPRRLVAGKDPAAREDEDGGDAASEPAPAAAGPSADQIAAAAAASRQRSGDH